MIYHYNNNNFKSLSYKKQFFSVKRILSKPASDKFWLKKNEDQNTNQFRFQSDVYLPRMYISIYNEASY